MPAPSRLRKRIARALMVSWREQPTRYDIEALQANIRRVGLVVRVRWALLVVLISYSVLAGLAYTIRVPASELAQLMAVPALALALVVVYNTFYSLNYRRLGNIALWNNVALALDAIVVTVLVYFSGGVNSWFWSMYSLFILEAAFILPRSRHVWLLALLCAGLVGAVEWLELLGVLPHQSIPFAQAEVHEDLVFVAVRYLWQVAVLFGTAWVSTLLVGEMRRELSTRRSQSLIDDTTGVYSRSYFMRAAPAEVSRALRDGRPIHVILLDIDRFGVFNSSFGIDAGDRLLQALASTITDTVAAAGDVMVTTNLAARFGGEEFVVLLAEDTRLSAAPTEDDALQLAERMRRVTHDVRIDGAGVTVSVGVASLPGDGHTAEELLDAADAALSCAIERGGDTVVRAAECVPASDEV